MKAIKYQIDIYDNALSLTHGFKKTIEEIFIPEREIAFNISGGGINIFKIKRPRGKGKEIKLDDVLADELVRLFKLKEKCFNSVQKLF